MAAVSDTLQQYKGDTKVQMESGFGTCTFCSCHPPPMLCVETSGRDFSVLHSTVIFLALIVFSHSSILQHPNVLQCIGQCVEAIPYLLVFEFCDLVSALTREAAVVFAVV